MRILKFQDINAGFGFLGVFGFFWGEGFFLHVRRRFRLVPQKSSGERGSGVEGNFVSDRRRAHHKDIWMLCQTVKIKILYIKS